MTDGPNFSPLTPRELEVAAREAARESEPDAAKPTIPPADAEPAEVAAERLFGRSPDVGPWRYALASGETAFHICRYNKPDGGKDFLPLCWFPGVGWRSKHWPAPRPLYNLDKIAANPDAPIVVCEGEKAADAAARIFPGWIATTSSGGAKAAAQTDWMKLEGHPVLIWPDVDKPGADHASEVAAILAEHGCDVPIIDADALAAVDPNGGARAPPKKGWDAADALAEWRDIEALRKAAASLTRRLDAGPAYVSFPPYTMDAGGLAIEKEIGRGEAKRTASVPIAAPFEVLGASRDPHGQGWGKVLRWRDDDGRPHVRHVADAALHGEPAALCGGLADHGLRIARAGQRDFVGYLSEVRPKRRLRIVTRTGWHEIGGLSVFVLPRETIGPRGGERVILDAAAHGPYEARGTIEEWREGPAKLAGGHGLLVLMISTALAGTLLRLADMEGGGINLVGPSSIGKTTGQRLVASAWGPPGLVRTWRATANGLEAAAAGSTDTVLILDELGLIEPRELGAALYSLANGVGKARAQRDGNLREPRDWRALIISSGELTIEAKLGEDRGRKSRAGQHVRMLDIPADRGLGFGVFDTGGPDRDAAAFAKACNLASAAVYGTAGPEFVRRLIGESVSGDDVRSMVNNFISAQVPPGADGQIDRAAHRLAIIAAAGELATAFGLTGWREDEVREAAAWALAQWIKGRGGTEAAEVRQAIEQIRLMIQAHGESRFQSLDDIDAKPVNNRLGWRKGAGAQREWWVLPEMWRAQICAGLDPQFVARVLGERRMLRRQGGNTLQCTVNLGGEQRARAYVLTAAILDGGGDAG